MVITDRECPSCGTRLHIDDLVEGTCSTNDGCGAELPEEVRRSKTNEEVVKRLRQRRAAGIPDQTVPRDWFVDGDVSLVVEETAVGKEYSIYEVSDGRWRRRYTFPEEQAGSLRRLLNEVVDDDTA